MPRKRTPEGGDRPESHAKMNDEIRAQIVCRLAMYDTVASVVSWLAEEHDITITKAAVSAYNATNASNAQSSRRRVAQKWLDLFHATREAWLKEIAAVPISQRAYRLRRLELLHDAAFMRAMRAKDGASTASEHLEATKAAAGLLEQAAKEIGNVYTNVAKVQGAALPGQVPPADMTPEERRNMLADRLNAALERMRAEQPTKH